MQGKEASEQETRKCSAGIDVSKSWLDAHIRPAKESLRVANTAEGIRRLKRWLLRHKVTLVVVEATGKWHRDVYRSLSASQIAVAVVDPYRVPKRTASSPRPIGSMRKSWRCSRR